MTTYSDASNSGWGGVFPDESDNSVEVRDYWVPSDRSQPIVIREALALKNTILAGAGSLAASRVDAHVDSLPLVRAWSNQGGKSKALSDVILAIYETTLKFNIALSLVYVPSRDNPADTLSRALSDSDCMLSPRVWGEVEWCWGPHSVDLMALDSNAPRDSHGFRLRHFTLWPSPESAGVNIFAQTLHSSDNAYVFPPLALVGIVLRFLSSKPCPFTFVTPDPHPRRYWWPLISGRSTDSVRLGALGDLTYFCFQLRMAHSLPSLYPGTFGRLGSALIPVFLFRVCSRSPAFGAQLYSVTNARIQMMTVSSSVRDVGSKDMVLMLWVPPPRSLKSIYSNWTPELNISTPQEPLQPTNARNHSWRLSFRDSWHLCNHARAYFLPHRGTLSDFWSGKMGRAKRWCTTTRVNSSVYRANGPVIVPLGYLQAQWTPLSENCDLFSMRWAVPVNGMIALVLEILPRTYVSSSILNLFNRSSRRPGYLRSKPPLSSLTNTRNWCTT